MNKSLGWWLKSIGDSCPWERHFSYVALRLYMTLTWRADVEENH